MSIMGKKVWAVVCGAIRQEFELYTSLAMLCDYRSKGLLDGIVISTWKGEIENIPRLREKFKQLEIYTVELDPLDDNIGKFMNINYARQSYQLKKGLDFVPDDIFVLKCRTDYSENDIKKLENVLCGNVDLSIDAHGAFQGGIKYKIAVRQCGVTIPFVFNDICFLGYKLDLYKTISFEGTITKYNLNIIPDTAFFANIFISKFHIIEEFFYYIKTFGFFTGEIFQSGLKKYLSANKECKNDFELPGIFNKFFAMYFVLLKTCFYFFDCYEENLEKFDFIDIFIPDQAKGVGTWWSNPILNVDIIKKITEGKCVSTKCYAKFYNEICKISTPYYAESMSFSSHDVNETAIWIKNVYNVDFSKWFNPYKSFENFKKSNVNFNKASEILFSDYISKNDKDDFFDLLNNNLFKQKINYYSAVFEILPLIQKENNDIYASALGAACRTELPSILKFAAKELYANQIKEISVSGLDLVFGKWGANPTRFYTFPLHPYKISAFYWYGKFAEPLGKLAIPKTFYTRLIQNFKLPARPEPQSYADAVLQLIKEIVSAHFDERMCDPSIHNMVDFLIDDFEKEAFTVEQWEAVAEYALNRKYSLPFKTADDDAFERLLAGAENAETELEAKIVSKLLLREKWNFTDLAKSADDTLSKLIEKYPVAASCFTKANFISEDEILTFNPNELDDNNDFVLLVRILAERKLLSHYAEVLLNLYGNNAFRRMILELFIKLEENEEVRFFSVKNSKEAWINYRKFSKSKINSELILQRNNDWWSWPFSDSASPSSYAALIRVDADKIFVSIEINSCPCTAKTKLLDALDKTKVNAFNKDDRIIRLRTATYQFESTDKIGEAVESALNNFCEVGELLLKAVNEVYKGEINQ